MPTRNCATELRAKERWGLATVEIHGRENEQMDTVMALNILTKKTPFKLYITLVAGVISSHS